MMLLRGAISVFVIGYILLFSRKMITRIHQQKIGEDFFHFILQTIKISEKNFTMFCYYKNLRADFPLLVYKPS